MLRQFVNRTLTPEIAPMVYIMMGVSVFIGFCFATGTFMNGTESVLYGTGESVLYDAGVLVHRQLWGAALFITASIAEVGFILNKDSLIRLGGISGFMAWTFACISLLLAQHWYVLVSVGLFHLLFHGYVVLATSMGYIRRAAIE